MTPREQKLEEALREIAEWHEYQGIGFPGLKREMDYIQDIAKAALSHEAEQGEEVTVRLTRAEAFQLDAMADGAESVANSRELATGLAGDIALLRRLSSRALTEGGGE